MFSMTKKIVLYGLAAYGAFTLYNGCTRNNTTKIYSLDDNINTIDQNNSPLEKKIVSELVNKTDNDFYLNGEIIYALYDKQK